MPDRTIVHADFTLERDFTAPPNQVFAAFTSRAVKRAWFAKPQDARAEHYELDFRAGGQELKRGRHVDGRMRTSTTHYLDIVPNERIVCTYEVGLDDVLISVSLATFEFLPEEDGTLLILTESGAFFGRSEKPKWRVASAETMLDALDDYLEESSRLI
ncbi:SRPBCC domain-containing protein [Rathayibacter soli]|uniref:SRPBCC domain-containing protein n=1 Tax=Rathayibacter soli TaxID=3144168 RepID=UPI0027E57120|nr:SRPBCC domain-containing protein [Glaciibacter superstes]